MNLKFIKLTGSGESHGIGYTGIIEGLPSGLKFSLKDLQNDLNRRKPGVRYASSRSENDTVLFYSGVKENVLTGAPLSFFIANHDQKSNDYKKLENFIRPGHADITRSLKYKTSHFEGGGLFSARWTVLYIVAGYFAKLILSNKNIKTTAYVSQIGNIIDSKNYSQLDSKTIDMNSLRMMDKKCNSKAEKLLENVLKNKTSVGSQVTLHIEGLPLGMGTPHTNKFNAQVSFALFSIPAVQYVSFGRGFNAPSSFGHLFHDKIKSIKNNKVTFVSNNSGGLLGGLTTGQDVIVHFGLKPPSSFSHEQEFYNTKKNKIEKFSLKGRFDPVLGPRCVPVAESIVALYTLDAYLEFLALQKLNDII